MNDKEKLKIAIQALRDIVDPVARLRRNTPPGCQLDGQMVIRLLESPNHFRLIAEQALEEIK